MERLWLIDGFNLIRRDGRLREIESSQGTEAAKRLLEGQLALLRAQSGRGVTVVVAYDGAPPRGARKDRAKGFRVVYAPSGRTADDVILTEARRAEGRLEVRVVTSDVHDIARRLRGLRVEHISVEEFSPQLWSNLKESEPDAEKPTEPSGGDVDFWLRQFGGDKT